MYIYSILHIIKYPSKKENHRHQFGPPPISTRNHNPKRSVPLRWFHQLHLIPWPFFGSRKIGGSKRSRNFFITLFYHIHIPLIVRGRGHPCVMKNSYLFPTFFQGSFRQLHRLHQKYNVRTMTSVSPPVSLTKMYLVPARHLVFLDTASFKGTESLWRIWIELWILSGSLVPVPVHLQHYNNCYYDMSFNGPCPLLSQVERGHFG